MRAILAFAAAMLLAACGQAAATSVPTQGPRTAAGVAATLMARPLRLPALRPNAPCPVTPIASLPAGGLLLSSDGG